MYQDNQPAAENNQGSNQQDDSFTGPYRHRGYKVALEQLREALAKENAVILKGVEGTGKSTLVAELISEYEHKGVPVAVFRDALPKASLFYGVLADTLGVPRQKNDLVRALRNTKEAGQFCFVVVDQDAINSSPEVENALKQLCLASETTAGAIKLVVIRKDYLVIHTDGTPEADFHNWISKEVTLDPLHTDDIEGYIYYLSAIKGIQPTPYEIGTDFLMIEKTEGRISRLKALLLPLIHKDVITRQDIQGLSKSSVKVPTNNTALFAFGLLAVLAIGAGLNHFILQSDTIPEKPATAEVTPVFADTSSPNSSEAINPPSLTNQSQPQSDPSPAAGSSSPSVATRSLDDLPTLSPNTDEQADALPPLELTSVAKPQPQPKAISAQPDAELNEDQFQNEVKQKLDIIEQQLNIAIAENKRLKEALKEAQQAKVIAESSEPQINKKVINEQLQTSIDKGMQAGSLPVAESSEESVDSTSVTTSEDLVSEQISAAVNKQDLLEKADSVAAEIITPDTEQQLISPEDNLLNKAIQQETASSLELAIQAVNSWQNAWANQDHATYVTQYKTGFNGAYKTHQQWLKKRHAALNKPGWIKLDRSEFIKTQESEDSIKLDFWLTYEADNGYKDRTHKRLTLELLDGRWLISKEQNIAVQPFF